MPQFVLLSLWRNDSARQLAARAQHLLQKTYPHRRYVWVVGDTDDDTTAQLRAVAERSAEDITLVDIGATSATFDRLARLSVTANAGLDLVQSEDDYWLIHESDLQSPPDLLERFLAHLREGRECLAGWPTLTMNGANLFYDTFAYRRDGQMFRNTAPYHPCYRPDAPFEVDSFGSVYLFPAEDVRAGMRCGRRACLDLCQWAKDHGRRLWVDPTLEIVQPADLWAWHNTESGA
jgi:hypothetical protein